MELKTVNERLLEIIQAHGPSKPDPAIQGIAIALMHIAKSIDELEKDVAVIRSRQVST